MKMLNSQINSFFSHKKILITGGLGFIGSNLAIKLAKLGADITIVDSLIPEYGGNLFNIIDIKDQVNLNISDVRDKHSMRFLIQNKDILFNLAGQTSHIDSMTNPEKDLEINAKAQLDILESCKLYNPNIKIVFASTRQIYGVPKKLPVDEEELLKPVDVNGINKIAGEMYHILYNNVYNINSCVLRLTNTYGPRMRIKDARQTFVGIWIKLILGGKPFEVWGGEQLRDFTYIDDCIDAMLIVTSNPKSKGQIYNLGGKEILTLKNLADKLILANNNKGAYNIKEFPSNRKKIDIGSYYSNFSKIENELNWRPNISIVDGLKRTLKYYNNSLKNYI